MNLPRPNHWIGLLLLMVASAGAEVIDRIAVGVGNSVITASDLDREIRVTAFLNGMPPDFTPAGKRGTAERMVEQKLIRRELDLSRYPAPDPSMAEPAVDQFKKAHYPSDAEFERAMAGAGVTLQELKDQILWQMTLLQFVGTRFRPGVQVGDKDIQDYFDKTVRSVAQAAHPGEPVSLDAFRDQIEETLTGQRADKELDNWLADVRRRTEIVFHEEVFR